MAYRQNDSQRRNDAFRFDLMEHIGVLSMRDTGWTREVNIVSWNGGTAKVDIREWDPDHKRMTKGIALYEEEAETLAKVLARRYGIRFADKEPARKFMTEESEQPEEAGAEEYKQTEQSGAVEYREIQTAAATAPADTSAPVSEAAAACVAETAAQMNAGSPVPVSEVVKACVAETAARMHDGADNTVTA